MLGSHVHKELIEVSITYPRCNEQWRSDEEREVVSFDWVSDGPCLVDKSLMDIGPCCSCPSFSIWRKLLIIAGSARSLLSSTKRSLVSSQNGLPISPMTCVSECTSLAKTTSVWSARGVCDQLAWFLMWPGIQQSLRPFSDQTPSSGIKQRESLLGL